jgi:hypothetical protein
VNKMWKPILCVDFDGVIHGYQSGWKGADQIPDPPVPGAIEWLLRAQDFFDVQIYSSRSSQDGGVLAMHSYLMNHALHVFGDIDDASVFMSGIKFPTQKPAAFLTIDDRAICFQGDFADIPPARLLDFKPWNKR